MDKQEIDKYGLCLPGGGDNGRFQVGVLKKLVDEDFFRNKPFLEVTDDFFGDDFIGFDEMTSTSVGSINGAAIAQFDKKDFSKSIPFLWDTWLKHVTCNRDIFRWFFPKYLGGLFHNSFATTWPLRSLLEKTVDIEKIRKSDVNWNIAVVNYNTGELEFFEKHSEFLIDAIMASAAYPAMMELIKINGQYYIDAGIRDIAPVAGLIKRGCTKILVICTHNPYKVEYVTNEEIGNTVNVLKRTLDIAFNEILRRDLVNHAKINSLIRNKKLVDSNYQEVRIKIIYPTSSPGNPLEFDYEIGLSKMYQGYNSVAQFFTKMEGVE